MTGSRIWLLLGSVWLATGQLPATADGLIHRLPADGTAVEYSLHAVTRVAGQKRVGQGTLVVRSVGTVDVDGRTARWLEFHMQTRLIDDGTTKGKVSRREVVAKVLIPETRLRAGQSPVDHVIKCWLCSGSGRPAVRLTDLYSLEAGPLPVFLAGPLEQPERLKVRTIKCGLGQLMCEGVRGSHQFRQGAYSLDVDMTSRLSPSVPFGVARCELEIVMRASDTEPQSMQLKLNANRILRDARSRVPNQ